MRELNKSAAICNLTHRNKPKSKRDHLIQMKDTPNNRPIRMIHMDTTRVFAASMCQENVEVNTAHELHSDGTITVFEAPNLMLTFGNFDRVETS